MRQVHADVVPGDAGVVVPARRQLHLLGDPGGHALLEDRLLPLGELLGVGGVALAQAHLAADGLGGVGVGADRALVHPGAGQGGVGEHHHVELARLEAGPLVGALRGRVGVAGDQALAGATGDELALGADDRDAVVGQHPANVGLPLPDDGVGDQDHGPAHPALLAGAGEQGDAGVGLAHAHVEGEQPAPVGQHPAGAGDLVGMQPHAVLHPAGEGQGLGVVGRRDVALEVAVVGVLDAALPVGVAGDPGPERLVPLLGLLDADLVERLLLPLLGLESGLVVVDPADAPAGLAGQLAGLVEVVVVAGRDLDEPFLADQLHLAVVAVQCLAHPGGHHLQRHPPLPR